MSSTLQVKLPPATPFFKPRAQAAASGSASLSYALLLLFLLQLYSSIAVLYPALEAVRPALTIGGLALAALLLERVWFSRGFVLVRPDSFFLVAFACAAALSAFGAFWPGLAARSTADFLKILILYFVVLNCVDSEKRLRGVVWTMVLAGLFPALGGLRFFQNGNTVDGRLHWVGTFGNPNELAHSLVILFPLAVVLASELKLSRRLLVWGLPALYAGVVYLTFSRGALLGLFAALGLMALLHRRSSARLVTAGLLAAGILAVVFYWTRGEGFSGLGQDASFQQRITTFQTALAMFVHHPLFGVGLTCSPVAWPFYAPANLPYRTWLIIHNTFLQALSETGLVGFLSLSLFFTWTLHRAWKTARLAAAAGQEKFSNLVRGLLASFFGFFVCAMSGGFVLAWFPYILAGLIGAASRIQPHAGASAAQPAPAATVRFQWNGARSPAA